MLVAQRLGQPGHAPRRDRHRAAPAPALRDVHAALDRVFFSLLARSSLLAGRRRRFRLVPDFVRGLRARDAQIDAPQRRAGERRRRHDERRVPRGARRAGGVAARRRRLRHEAHQRVHGGGAPHDHRALRRARVALHQPNAVAARQTLGRTHQGLPVRVQRLEILLVLVRLLEVLLRPLLQRDAVPVRAAVPAPVAVRARALREPGEPRAARAFRARQRVGAHAYVRDARRHERVPELPDARLRDHREPFRAFAVFCFVVEGFFRVVRLRLRVTLVRGGRDWTRARARARSRKRRAEERDALREDDVKKRAIADAERGVRAEKRLAPSVVQPSLEPRLARRARRSAQRGDELGLHRVRGVRPRAQSAAHALARRQNVVFVFFVGLIRVVPVAIQARRPIGVGARARAHERANAPVARLGTS